MKSHHSGNLCNGILCSSSLWTGFQRRNSRRMRSAFLLAPHPPSWCRANRRCKVKMKQSEPFGSSLALSRAVGLSSHGPGGFGWATPRPVSPRQEHVWGTEVHHCRESLGWGDGQRCQFTSGHSVALLLRTSPWPWVAAWVRIDARGSVHASFLFETTWVHRKSPGTERCVSACNTTGKYKLRYVFHIDFSSPRCSIFNLNGSRLRHRMGKNVLSYTTGKRAWFSDSVSMLSN